MENDEINIIKIKDTLLSSILDEIDHLITQHIDSMSVSRLLNDIQSFQPSPQLLDKRLNKFISSLCEAYDLEHDTPFNITIAEVFYQFTKVRGYKAISNCLSSDIYLIEPIFKKFSYQLDWKQNFFLLLWLSILIMNPFLLSSVNLQLSEKVYLLAFTHFSNNSKELDAAVILMSRFLSRSDNKWYLTRFYDSLESDISEYAKFNYLKTINNLLKIGKMSNLVTFLPQHYKFVQLNLESDNLNIMKYSIKNLGKLGQYLIQLENSVDLLEDIINLLALKLDYNSTVIRYCASRQLAKIAVELNSEFQQDLLTMIIQDLDIPNLGRNSYTILQIDFDLINVNQYHGVLMTIAEFLNLRLILQSDLACIISILHETLFLEQNRLTYTVGSNVRDLSCYISWSLVKKYKNLDPSLLKHLFEDLLLTCLFDKEILIRRSASAVIQELIGRYGDSLYAQYTDWQLDVSHSKLKIIEILDFSTLGDIKRAFKLSLVLAEILNYSFRDIFVKHLFELCFHSDYQIRKLSIEHLVKLLKPEDIEPLIDQLVNELNVKPGYFFLLSELVQLHPTQINSISRLVSSQKFSSHRDSFTKGEELLYIISVLLNYDDNIFANNTDLIFSIIKASKSPEILSKLVLVVANLHSIPEQTFNQFVYHLKMGNNLAVANSLQALDHLTVVQLNQLFDIIKDSKYDADVRSALIDSLSIYFHSHPFENLVSLVNNLDDYTITSEGDVGSKLRLSTIRFIRHNLPLLSQEKALLKYIKTKLIRLNFDMIDKVRHESFDLFLLINGWKYQLNEGESHFDLLLEMYLNEILKKEDSYSAILDREFWKGYTMLAGAVISSNKLIRSALTSLLRFLGNILDNKEKIVVFNHLSGILSKNCQFSIDGTDCFTIGVQRLDLDALQLKCKDRLFKLQNSCLILFQRFFELNVQYPEGFDFKSLFIKVFNLQLNQLSQTRLKACFKLFKCLYLMNDDQFFRKGKNRLIQMMCTSKHGQIRVICSNVLYELYYEADGDNDHYLKKIDEVDWSSVDDFTKYIKFFK